MMKKFLVTVLLALGIVQAQAQWQVPAYNLPIGRGPGVVGFTGLAPAALGNVLLSGGVSALPSWGKVDLTTHVTGVLPVANGGTGGGSSFTQGSVIFVNPTGGLTQDNANFFFDDTNNRLGLSTAAPAFTLDVNGTARSKAFTMPAPSQGLVVAPTGNTFSTLSSINSQGSSIASSQREFLVNLGFTTATGSGASGVNGNRDKVTLYSGIIGQAGGGDVWAGNFLTKLETGWSGAGHILELDFDNRTGTNFDAFGATAQVGISISGASNGRKTAAIQVSEAGKYWNHGLIFVNDSINTYSFYDLTNPVASIKIGGIPSAYAIDLNDAVVGSQIRLRNNTSLVWRNVGDTADLVGLTGDNNNKLFIGASYATAYTYAKVGIGTNGPGAPLQVYAGNATTSTPDISDIVILSQSINSQLPTSGTIGHAIRIGQTLGDTATLKGNVHGIGIVQTVNNAANITGGVTEIVPFIHLLEATAAGTNSGINYWGSDFNIAGPTTGQEGFMGWVWQGTKYNSGTTIDATHHGSVGHAMVTTPFAGAAARVGQTSYPIDVGIFAGGWAGTSQAGGQAAGATNGYTVAFQAGGRATPWMPGDSGWKSKIGTGFYALDHTAYGIKIGTRHADATGQAIYVQSDGGGVGIWRTPDTSQPFVVGGDTNGQRLMWLINASTGSSATAIVRAESDTVTTDMVSGSAAGGAYSQFIGRGSGGVLVDASHASGIIQFRPQGGATTIATVTSTGFGIGTTGPIAPFEINKAQAFAHVTSTSALSAYIRFASSGRNTWNIGNSLTVASAFEIYNETNTTTWLSISSAGVTTVSTLNLTNALGTTYGGTGFASYAVGDLLYANTTTTLAKLADVATGNVLISGGVTTAPSWGKVAMGTHVSPIGASQIPYMNTGNTAFVSSVNLTFNGSQLYVKSAAQPTFLIETTSAASNLLEFKDGAGTPNRWWVGQGAGTTTDGVFFIRDARQSVMRFIIDTSGAVAIGGTTANSKFNVIGDLATAFIQPTSSTSTVAVGAAAHNWTSSFTWSLLRQYSSAATGTTLGLANANLGWIEFNNVSAALISAYGNVPVVFAQGVGGTLTEVMRLSSGNVMVGTTTDGGWSGDGKLMSKSTNAWSGSFHNDGTSGGTLLARVDNTAVLFASFRYAGGTQVGSISTNGTVTAYNTSSDKRLKEDWRPFERSGVIIDALEIWDFKWKAAGSRAVGVLAQDAYGIFPDMIQKPANDDDTWGADYSKLVPVLIAEIQAMRKRVSQLEAANDNVKLRKAQ